MCINFLASPTPCPHNPYRRNREKNANDGSCGLHETAEESTVTPPDCYPRRKAPTMTETNPPLPPRVADTSKVVARVALDDASAGLATAGQWGVCDPNVRPADVPRLSGQNAEVCRRLLAGEKLTPADALAFGCMRLAARVKDLRNAGVPVKSERIGSVARYSLDGSFLDYRGCPTCGNAVVRSREDVDPNRPELGTALHLTCEACEHCGWSRQIQENDDE